MRVWLAPSAFFPLRGGVEELTLKLATHLQGRGHEVLVVTNQHPRDLPAADEVDGVRVARLPFHAPGASPRQLRAYRRAGTQVRRALPMLGPAPEVLHVVCASVQLPALLDTVGPGTATVVTTQGETEMDADRLYQRSAWMRRQLRRWSSRADALTACSTWTARRTAEIAPAFARARVVPNGVDPLDWSGLPPRPAEPVVAAWGRHVPQKGFDLLLAAFDEVRRRVPDAQLLLGGDGPEHERLRAQAGEGVQVLGPLDRAGVADLLGRSRIAVVPSRVEPFGIVALEALAAGRGLVWSTRGGLEEAAGTLGRGADPFDLPALADAIVAELADPVEQQAAARHVRDHTWEVLTDIYEQVYDEARQRRSRA